MEGYYNKLLDAELCLAQLNPLTELEYQLNQDPVPLKLFDCFLPTFKAYMKSKPEFASKHGELLQQKNRQEDSYYMQSNQTLRIENRELRQRNEQLEEELKMLDMFSNMIDQGFNNTTLLRKM